MPSIVSGFEYDIFISYRHNDNLPTGQAGLDGWVTDFVQNLEKELRSTLKDTVTIYFDKNPHDGLLETHHVDKSLEGKLKCLIFIPIVSQTYCDPKSFAWQHEFCAFNTLAKQDPFGRDIKLSGGNVASRILPVKIHDIDAEDKALLENELGGALRAIEFIFKSPGVNRPLTTSDNPDKNQNKTFYRDQVNKTANAVKEIITALKNPVNPSAANTQYPTPKTRPLSVKAISLITLGIMVLIALAYTASQFIGSSETDKSIAVLPFVNMSNDPEQEYFSDGMTDEVLNRLFKIGELRVISRTSSMKFKGAKLTTKEIAEQLGVANILEGSVQKAGNRLKITVQLIDASTDSHLWSETYERDMDDVFAIQSEIAQGIARELRIKLSTSVKNTLDEIPTQSKLAYDYYLRARKEGEQFVVDGSPELLVNSISLYSKAIEADSLFTEARYYRIWNLLNAYFRRSLEKVTLDEYRLLANQDIQFLKETEPASAEYKRALATRHYTDRNYSQALSVFAEVLAENPNDLEAVFNVALIQRRMGSWKESTSSLEICLQRDPLNEMTRSVLVSNYRSIHQPEKALALIKTGLGTSPNSKPLKEEMMWRLIEMGYDVPTAAKESGIDPQDQESSISYLINPGNTSVLDKQRIEGKLTGVHAHLNYSWAYYYQGNHALSKVYADSTLVLLVKNQTEIQGETNPDDVAHFYKDLGQSYALAGNERLAIQYAQKAVDTLPITLDAFYGTGYEVNLVAVYLLLNKHDLALDKIEMLLSIPSQLSVGLMMVDPIYKPLHNLPPFKQLAEKYKYRPKN